MMNKNFLTTFLVLFLVVFVGINNYSRAQSCPSNTQYSSNYAILAGAVTDTGGDNNVQVWFEWGTSPDLNNSTPVQNIYVSSVPHTFCYTLTSLQPCTTYYYRAAIRNSLGTNYGSTYSFTTRCSVSNPLTVSCYASPNPVNVNSPVTFYSSVSGGTGNYTYSWSGACTSYSSTCSRTFSSPGVYNVNLTVTSGSFTQSTSCSVNVISSSQVVPSPIINQPPVPVIAFSPERILPGTIVNFDASRSYDPDGQIISYKWEINGELVSSEVSFNRALASGTYRIKLTVTDNQGASSNKEILINVGRTVYLPRTRVVTRTVPVQATTVSSRLVNLLLDKSYNVKICSKNELQFTLVNNTSVNRKITINVEGEASNWFNPQSKTFILKPFETLLFKWNVDVPCNLKEGDYEVRFFVTTPGANYEYSTILEAKSETNFLTPILGFIGGIFSGWNLLWILILLLIIFNAYLWYKIFKKKEVAAA